MRISADEALKNKRVNGGYSQWNASPSSSVISTCPESASRRIFEEYAVLRPPAPPTKHESDSPVFTMGSCFAREIENAIILHGGNVVSIDNVKIDRDEFKDINGKTRSGFFHRFTPRAMLQEFMIAVDEIPGWDMEHSLIFFAGESCLDFNYWEAGLPRDAGSTLSRRKIAADLVRNFKESSLIILTLGLNESWVHKPTGLHCNRIDPKIIHSRREDFELEILGYEEVLTCLSGIYELIQRHHKSGDFQLVVTVSPVPMQTTFQSCDIIIANELSKSTLRSAAGFFCSGIQNVTYYPSYEMVRFTKPELAWRPDRVHVNKSMVQHIVRNFIDVYFNSKE